ncbi:glycosyltransferase [Enterobacter cancerogenus]|uniref:glycosyltransferase n=1 Tax=Enterobacter cancerogenus TaxID=69218 RepID=UPI00307606EB
MKAFIFVNDNGAAYKRFKKNDIPAQFAYGVSKLEKMGFEISVGQGNLVKDLITFLKFKPDLFFMPFVKRKTMLFFILSKIFFLNTKFAGWMHLDIFSPPASKVKKIMHGLLLPFLQTYVRQIDAIFFLSKRTRDEISTSKKIATDRCHFIPWGGESDFYAPFLAMHHFNNIISTGRENRDLPSVMESLKNSNVAVDIYTSDLSLPDTYLNANGHVFVNKGRWEYKDLLKKVSASKCMIIPIKSDKINYCVGLSSLIEAIALGLPVIATFNPYWYIDIEKENVGIFIKDNSIGEWTRALELLDSNPTLVAEMSANALALFKEKCDFTLTENILAMHIDTLFEKA